MTQLLSLAADSKLGCNLCCYNHTGALQLMYFLHSRRLNKVNAGL